MRKINIFVEVGSHKMQFERLLKEIDTCIENGLNAKIFAQTGYTKYKPKNYSSKPFISEKEFIKRIKQADLVIGHAGAGNIISVLTQKKPLVIVPRKVELKEHTDSHQTELAKILAKEGKCIAVFDEKELKTAIEHALTMKTEVKKERMTLEKQINSFIVKLENKV